MKNKSDTPRSDVEYKKWLDGADSSDSLFEFCQKLELELNTALADLSLRRDLYALLEKERDNLYEQIQNLRRDA